VPAMRIKKIEVVGFKSFADREVVILDDKVTGVIGPNGCGKSNIVDAIRWCLGEQRAKHLRGQGMADVIFAGSSTRGPAGSAEVTLTFENEGDVPAAYLSYAEIAVTRRLYRDGTSEYLLNKVPCRLRDISEMLMGTGVGTKGYSIIEQGRVSQIVTSKPEARRHILDEAAGITRFKAQKHAAERKIAQTQQNLLRVTDVIGELETRLGTLRRQAQKAERYRNYRDELRDLELWSASHKFLELETMSAVLRARHKDLGEQVDALRTESGTRETRIETQRIELGELERILQAAQQEVFDLENRVQLVEQERKYKQQEGEGLERSAGQSEVEAQSVERGLATLEDELSGVVERQAGLVDDEDSEGAANRASRAESLYEELATKLDELGTTIGGARSTKARIETELATATARLAALAEGLESEGERVAVTTGRVAEIQGEVQEAGARRDDADERLTSTSEAVAAQRQSRATLDANRAQARDQLQKVEVEVETARKELLRARSRLQSLEEIQQRYRGCQSGVQVVMEHREKLAEIQLEFGGGTSTSAPSPEVHGIMADFIRAPERYEAAVSAVLGDRLQGVVVDQPMTGASGVQLLKGLKEGRTTFLPAGRGVATPGSSEAAGSASFLGWSNPADAGQSAKAGGIDVVDISEGDAPAEATNTAATLLSDPAVIGRLADLVEFEGAMASLGNTLLGDALVVENLAVALELWQRRAMQAGATLVTLDGDRIEPSGVVVGGAPDAVDSALLQQKREIRELQEIAQVLESEFSTARAKQQGSAERVEELENLRETSERDVLEAEKARVAAQQERDSAASTVSRLETEHARLTTQLNAQEARFTEREAEAAELSAVVESHGQALPEAASGLEALEAELEQLSAQREQRSQELTEAKVALARWQQESEALKSTRSRIEKQLNSERDRARRLHEAAREQRERIAALVGEAEAMGSNHAELLEKHKAATAAKHDAREQYDAAKVAVDELDVSVRNLRGQLEEERERFSEVELGLRELDLERSHLVTDVQDRFDDELRFVVRDYHDRAVAGPEQRKRAKELKRLLSRMGEVNLTAITEFEEVSGRYEYLTGQRADLESAIDSLQEAIDRINATTKERFKETFEQVNDMFQKLFPRLFNGGRAELLLTQPDDLLNTGVEIIAQPPGKKAQSLELLSGGEKALTAVSLIFGIFLIKPSPFCLLDEVDAPLDEANVGRFCDMVSELSEGTQFILITHNKRTMEIADRLYGVTMQSRGVSKLVSVNMTKTVSEARYS
jgi:chromosome segregation protein